VKRLARQRRSGGLTQIAVSRATGIPISRIAYAESGRIRLSRSEIMLIEAVLRSRVAKLFDAVGV
jgi:transcriptional regulator with XRE-family HTH domain